MTPLARLLLLAVLAVSARPGQAQQPPRSTDAERRDYLVSHYTKYEHMVPMRDGVRLFTTVYLPKDESHTYPILMQRTPYSVAPYGEDNYYQLGTNLDKFFREGFIFVHQDVRGRNKSEGVFIDVRPYIPVKHGPKDVDESSDAYDTIEWLLKHVPNHNGKVGIWGISYPGFYAAMAAIGAHPALKAASPQAPIADWFLGDDWHHNGALLLAHAYDFHQSFGRPYAEPGAMPPPSLAPFQKGTPDGYDYFLGLGPLRNINPALFQAQSAHWNELLTHDTYDAYWKARNFRPYLKNITPALLTVGGWYDAEDLFGALNVYSSAKLQGPPASNQLVMGPWPHGGWMGDGDHIGEVRFGAKTAEFFRDEIMLPFFVHHLKGKGDPKLPEAYVFETGRNQWRKHDAWPPRNAAEQMLYLGAGGKLSFSAPAANAPGYDEYVSDPSKPVPFTDEIAPGMAYTYMTSDQRFAARRPDVLVYRSAPLEEDVTLAGPIDCNIFVSTSGTDSDWVVKLIDIYPGSFPDPDPNPAGVRMGGYQQLVRGEPFRGRFRNGFDKPEAFKPGQVAKVGFTMPDVYHTFRRGHSIAVQIQSSWFPLVDRNPQKFVPLATAAEADFQKATQRVYRAPEYPSSLTVRVLK